MYIKYKMLLDVVMYLVLFVAVVVVYLIEKRDWICINSYDLWSECQEGDGMPYRGSKPEESDTCKTLLKKINIASNAESASIKWRRAFILGASISILLFILIVNSGTLPSWTTMYISTMITSAILYFNFNYHSYHRFKKPKEYIKESTKLLSKKIQSGTCFPNDTFLSET